MAITPDLPEKSIQNKAGLQREKVTYRGKEVTRTKESEKLILLDRLKPQAIAKGTSDALPQVDHAARIQRQMLPMIDLVEIKQWGDIEELMLTLQEQLKPELRTFRPQVTTVNLSHMGIDKEIQVIGNKYIPLKRSEHEAIYTTLREQGHRLGIENQGLTLVVIEDEIFDQVMEEFARHSAMLTQPLLHEQRKSSKGKEKEIEPRIPRKSDHRTTAHPSLQWQKVAKRLIANLKAEKGYKKERDKERQIEKLLQQDEVIKHAVLQYERLKELVQKESLKRELTQEEFKVLTEKWAESLPPFPIRTVDEVVLWRELKPKMIEELLRHFRRL